MRELGVAMFVSRLKADNSATMMAGRHIPRKKLAELFTRFSVGYDTQLISDPAVTRIVDSHPIRGMMCVPASLCGNGHCVPSPDK